MNTPLLTLTEAITLLAFSVPLDSHQLKQALTKGQFGPNAYGKLSSAAAVLCDAGFEGKIVCFGRKAANSAFAGEYVQLTKVDFLTYRQFHYIDDGLLRGDETLLDANSEYDLAFRAGSADHGAGEDLDGHRDYYTAMKVERGQFDARLLELRARLGRGKAFTAAERRGWIRKQPQMSADEGYRRYKVHPQYDGTKQAGFRAEWKQQRNTKVGAPRKKPPR